MKLKKSQKSVNEVRFSREPLEKTLVEVWREYNNRPGGYGRFLQFLMSPKQPIHLENISNRDLQVAETVIQWLGSPVGQGFLEEVNWRLVKGEGNE